MSAARLLHPLRKQPPFASPALPKRIGRGASGSAAFVPRGRGEALAPDTRRSMEQCFGHDFSEVRVHAGRDAARAARAMDAAAFASGTHIGFAHARYDPSSETGRALLAHELAHVVQQAGTGARPGGGAGATLEAEADAAAEAATRGAMVPPLSSVPPQLQRRVEIRDVGRGEASGMARLGELMKRLNTISTATIFSVGPGGALQYVVNPYGDETEFDRQMRGFMDAGVILPMRMTNRRGLTRTRETRPRVTVVDVDDFTEGYVDIDDLLAADDLGLQTSLVHLLRERQAVPNYTGQMGSRALAVTDAGNPPAFGPAHSRGFDAELALLQDFFGDPGIHFIDRLQRILRTSRGDTLRERDTRHFGSTDFGILEIRWEVILRGSRQRMTPAEYRDLLRREENAAARRRLLELRGAPRRGPAA